MILRPKDFMYIRVEVTSDYPGCPFGLGDILNVIEFEGKEYIAGHKNIYPKDYPKHFRKLRWHDHRTLEQLLSIKYMKVVEGSSYYGVGDIVEVLHFTYNNSAIVGGRDSILFNLKGHFFDITQLQPATKEEHDKFWDKNKSA